jgi:hypothetical protein
MKAADLFVDLLIGYAGVGIFFAAVFLCFLVDRFDPVAKGSSIGFRLMILPGVAALWPVLLTRIVQGGGRS